MIRRSVLPVIWKTLVILFIVVRNVFIFYAILFSVTATVVIIVVAKKATEPFVEIKKVRYQNPVSTIYMDACRKKLREQKDTSTILQTFVPLDSISPWLVKAVIAAEDDGFFVHPGFDIAAILQAVEYNKSKNHLAHGASTITQQMAKNLFSGGKRNFLRKYMELVYTVLMEAILGKERILELYLNYAQWGKNIFGCEAASQFYFKQSCKKLTLFQAAKLAAVLAKPETLSPLNGKSIFISKRLAVIAANLYRKHLINDETYVRLGGGDSAVIDQLRQKALYDTSLSSLLQDITEAEMRIPAPAQKVPAQNLQPSKSRGTPLPVAPPMPAQRNIYKGMPSQNK
ncbi:MAG: monofunctional biosynthetic peptidoglycan transglycosylase [Chitinivibrionales bacterium]|nr:monofunctional biosynthetic peptidoglycan transglycosylase [Chitinivibrionales bacterium]